MPHSQIDPRLQRAEELKAAMGRSIDAVDFQYEYPRGLDLHPSSELSKRIVGKVMERARASKRVLDGVKDQWRKMDWTLTAYMPADADDRKVMDSDSRKPVTVVIPMTFAARELYLTYMNSAFFSRPEIHRYDGVGGREKIIRAAMMERVIAKQDQWFKAPQALLTMMGNSFTYGIGMVSPMWKKSKARVANTEQVDAILSELLGGSGIDARSGDTLRFFEETLLQEGNSLRPLDPYRLLLDPSTPILNQQEAEWVGWMWEESAFKGLSVEEDPEEFQFNARYVHMLAEQGAATSSLWDFDADGRGDKVLFDGTRSLANEVKSKNVHNITMLQEMIPALEGIGDEMTPRKYVVTVAADTVIRQLTPLNLDHGMYNIATCAPNSNGHDIVPTSHLMTTYGIQLLVDFMVKSRTDNIRKVINDMIIYDPSMIDQEDIMNPGPGKLIRLMQPSFGQGNLDAYIKQLNVVDVTAGHSRDIEQYISLMQRANGTEDIAFGDLSNLPERPTATGINAAQQGGLSRLQFLASKISMQAMQDIAFQEAYNTIQFMSQEVFVKMQGRQEKYLRREFGISPETEEILVSPFDMEPSFDVFPHTGANPAADDLGAMQGFMSTAISVEGVAAQMFDGIDLQGIFLQFMRKSGFEDIQEFIQEQPAGAQANLDLQALPDDQVQEQVQAGNIVPRGEFFAA